MPVRFAIAIALAGALATPAAAQETEWDANAARMTRPTLEGLLARYERAAESSAYSEVLREEAREQAEFTRRRLEQGDFRAGDRVYILVEDYADLTDTLSVASDQTITLPGVGKLELAGALRSELQARVLEAISRTIRDPRIRTKYVPGGASTDSPRDTPSTPRMARSASASTPPAGSLKRTGGNFESVANWGKERR